MDFDVKANLNKLVLICFCTALFIDLPTLRAQTTNQQLSSLFFRAKTELNNSATTVGIEKLHAEIKTLITKHDAAPAMRDLAKSLDLSLMRELGEVDSVDYITAQSQMGSSYTLPISELQEDYLRFVKDTRSGTTEILRLVQLSENMGIASYFTTSRGLRDAAEIVSTVGDTTTTIQLLSKSLQRVHRSESNKYYGSSALAYALIMQYQKKLAQNQKSSTPTLDMQNDIKLIVTKCPLASMCFRGVWWNILLEFDQNELDEICRAWKVGVQHWGQTGAYSVDPIISSLEVLFEQVSRKKFHVNAYDFGRNDYVNSLSVLLTACNTLRQLDAPRDTSVEWLSTGSDLYYNALALNLGMLVTNLCLNFTNWELLPEAQLLANSMTDLDGHLREVGSEIPILSHATSLLKLSISKAKK